MKVFSPCSLVSDNVEQVLTLWDDLVPQVVWKSTMGEPGRLQSNVVQRKLPSARTVEVSAARSVCCVGVWWCDVM